LRAKKIETFFPSIKLKASYIHLNTTTEHT